MVQSVPGGWAKELVHFRQVDGYDPIKALESADSQSSPFRARHSVDLSLPNASVLLKRSPRRRPVEW